MPIEAPEHLVRKVGKYDDPRTWHETPLEPIFDTKDYQRRIDEIVGTSNDHSIVRLIWSWKSREFLFGRWQAKYRAWSVTVGEEVYDISPPRWILEERFEPGQYFDAWQATRYIKDPATGELLDKGEPPRDGWYGYLHLCAEHEPNGACCERAYKCKRRRCWGYYREPNDADLDLLRRAMKRKAEDNFKQSPHEPLSAETLAEIAREEFAAIEEEEERKSIEVHDMWTGVMRTHGHRLWTDDPSVLKHGKYHFMNQGYKETPSGLLVPE